MILLSRFLLYLYFAGICSASTIATIPDRDQHTTDAQIEMTCKCSNSKPSPTITWFKDGSKLANGGRVSISSNKLVISKLQIADSGNYQCNASNFLGTKESPVKTIQVLSKFLMYWRGRSRGWVHWVRTPSWGLISFSALPYFVPFVIILVGCNPSWLACTHSWRKYMNPSLNWAML